MSLIASPRDRRHVTIMFADIAGSTSMIEKLDVETAHGLFAPAIKIMSNEIERFSGHVAEVLGDGLMAIFGAPHTLEDHAIRACHAALAIQEKIARHAFDIRQQHGLEFLVRVGLNSGTVVLSVTGEGDRETYNAGGSPVHLAARVESKAPAGGIAVSMHTHELIKSVFECESLGSFSLKGFSAPEVIYRVLRPRDQHGKGRPPSNLTATVPMIGRESQRRQLRQMVEGLNHGRGGFVLVNGEAGSGKTRFMSEGRTDLGTGLLWLEGQSSSYDQRVSYWPFIEILTAWLDLPRQGSEDRSWALLVERLQELFGAEADEVIPYVAALMGMTVREPYALRVKFLETDVLSRQILRAMRRLFERMAARLPVVIAIDDFHWADDSSVRLVEHLLGLCAEARILICVISRTDGSQAARVTQAARDVAGLDIAEIVLKPLPVEESVNLLERLIGTDPLTRYLRDQILYKAGGNPFFIEEVVRNLKASGILVEHVRNPGNWLVTTAEVSVPDTIHDVVMARVDRLDARLKQLLSVASVIGRHFLYSVLKSVTERVEAVDGTLSELEERQFIEEAAGRPEVSYNFRHALMQEAIYESILLEQRRTLHRRIADCLIAIVEGRTQGVASVLAFHYARADEPEKALRYLLEAADQAVKIAADAEALKCYEDALRTYGKGKAAPWEPWQKATIERRLAEIHFHRGNLEVAAAHFASALEACGDPLPAVRLGLLASFLQQLLIQFGHRLRGVTLPANQTPLAREDETHLRIYESFSWLMLYLDHERMAYAILKILNLAERWHWAEGMAKAASGFGAALDIINWHGLARRYHARALAWAEQSANPAAMGMVECLFGLHEAYVGRWDPALDRLASAHELTLRTGDLNTRVACRVYQAFLLTDRGAFAEVLALSSDMGRQGREAAFDLALRASLTMKGETMWRLGATGEARVLLQEALRQGLAAGDIVNACWAWGELGLCLCEAGDIDAAAKELVQAEMFVRKRKIQTFVIVPVLLGSAQVEVARLEMNGPQPNAGAALRRCRDAVSIGRRYHFGLPRALRIMGAFCWLEGRRSAAQRRWQESLSTALKVGAQYEIALTRIEIGRRLGLADELQGGEELLRKCRAVEPPVRSTQA